jgi:hypothetical protein
VAVLPAVGVASMDGLRPVLMGEQMKYLAVWVTIIAATCLIWAGSVYVFLRVFA